jgi:hypothetical protein
VMAALSGESPTLASFFDRHNIWRD